MAKAPRNGHVKTRLSPPLTSEQATALSICFLRDTAENLDAIPSSRGVVSFTPPGSEDLFENILPASFTLVLQHGDGFGERLLCTAKDILTSGYSSVCLIDSDSPTVPAEAYEQAVEALGRPGDRVVLGPTADGGYYLIGLRSAHARLFEEIDWSTERVYTQTLDRARELKLEVVELPLWYDVDDGPTLQTLRAELLAGILPGFALMPGYPALHTRELLRSMDTESHDVSRATQRAGDEANESVEGSQRPLESTSESLEEREVSRG